MNGKNNNAYDAFSGASGGNELLAMIAYGLFKKKEKAFLNSIHVTTGKFPSLKDQSVFFAAETAPDVIGQYIEQAEYYLAKRFKETTAAAVKEKVDDGIRAVEIEIMGQMTNHIRDWSIAHGNISSSLTDCSTSIVKLSGFWRGIASGCLSGILAGIITVLLTGLYVTGTNFKDSFTTDGKGGWIFTPLKPNSSTQTK